jgi:transposase
MEATGKYHRLAHQSLEGMGFLVMVVNPYQSKNFAKAPRTNRAHAIHEGSTHRDHPGQVGRTPSMRALRIAVTPDKSGARHP